MVREILLVGRDKSKERLMVNHLQITGARILLNLLILMNFQLNEVSFDWMKVSTLRRTFHKAINIS